MSSLQFQSGCLARRVSFRPFLALFMVSLFLFSGPTPVEANETMAQEYSVKAAFLVNFAKFVDWPKDAVADGELITIGVLGKDPFGGVLDAIVSTKNAKMKRFVVRRYQDLDDLGPCHILFISPQDERTVMKILEALDGRPVLTVGESDAFPRCGGIINFSVEQDRVRLEINQASAEKAQLKISAKLLRLQKR